MKSFQWSQWATVVIIVVSSFLVPAATPTTSVAAPVEARTDAALLLADATTLTIGVNGFAPQVLEVEAGQSVTFKNEDARARTIIIADPSSGTLPTPVPTATASPTTRPVVTPTMPSHKKVFVPLVVSSGGQNVVIPALNAVVPQAVRPAAETVTIRPGESITRTFTTIGNIVVSDAENASVSASLAVVPVALNKSGNVSGVVVDWQTKQPIAGARIKTLEATLETSSDAQGRYRLPLPPGEYTLVVFANGYTFANRKVLIQSFTPEAIETLELVPLDAKVVSVGRGGGTATNTQGNTNVVFAGGAVTSTKAIRLTDLPVDEFKGDFAALPGPFTDGKIPLGFVMFEPDGTHFDAPAVWTIDYDGPLPVGTDVPCYYWLEDEARWGEPVPGKVVDLGNGKKGLRATLPHFSSYGFAAPPPPEPQPPDPPAAPDPSGPPDIDDNPSAPDSGCPKGSLINMMSGELCQTIGTLPLPAAGGSPTQVIAQYRSLDLAASATISTTFRQKPTSATPDVQRWRFEIAGRVFTGSGSDVNVVWDGKDSNGVALPPGSHRGKLTAIWQFNVSSGIVRYEVPVDWTVELKRSDISPWGRGWFSGHDTLLIDRGSLVTIIQGDGRQLNWVRSGSTYQAPRGEESTLTRANNVWTRTYRDGTTLRFNANGRLTRIADRYGNAQVLVYESSGRVIPAGSWGLTTRLRRITDTSGNSLDFTYTNGWLSSVSDNTGRVYRYEHDAGGFLTALTDPLGQRQTFTYDARGMMTSHTDRRKSTTRYTLDDRGRVRDRTWPAGTVLRMTYAANQTTMTTDLGTPLRTVMDEQHNPVLLYNGVYTTTTTYDDDLRPQTTDHPPQTTLYDQHGNVIAVAAAIKMELERAGPYDQVTRAQGSDGTDTRQRYDAQGNLVERTDALGQRTTMTYDTHGQVVRMTDAMGQSIVFVRDARGLITKMTDALGRSTTLAYDARGNVTETRDALGRTSTARYDVLDRMTAFVNALNGTTSYGYNANGNMTAITDASGRKLAFGYDPLGRLNQVTFPDNGVERRAYDADGNLIGITDALGRTTRLDYDGARRVTRKRPAGAADVNYTYDTYDQLIAANDGTISTTMRYQPGSMGMVQSESQSTLTLPLTATLDYDYGDGLPVNAGAATSIQAKPAAARPAAPQHVPTAMPEGSLPPAEGPEPTPQPIQRGLPPMRDRAVQPNTPLGETGRNDSGNQPYAAEPMGSTIVVNGTIDRATTWTSDNVYVIRGDLTVAAGAMLTIKPGTVVKFSGGYDDLFVLGTLVAQGTTDQRIVFTSIADDTFGGDTNGDGPSSGTAGQWGHIDFATGSVGRISDAYIGNGGWYYSGYSLVSTSSDKVTFERVTFERSEGYGLSVNGTTTTVKNSSFIQNGVYGLYVNGLGTSSLLSITGNTFRANKNFAMRLMLNVESVAQFNIASNTGGENGRNGASVTGTLNRDLVWNNGLPLVVEGDLTVAKGATLTMQPGTTMKFAGGYDDLFVQGKLLAQGTATKGVAFTSLSDDAHGGDTDGNGVSEGTSSQWGHIDFAAGSTGRFTYAYIGHGGWYYSGNTLVSTTSDAVSFDQSTLASSGGYGLYAANVNPALTRSTFQDNTSYGLYYDGLNATAPLTATSNTFTRNGSAAARILFTSTPRTLAISGNTASGNSRNGFSVAGTLERSLDWTNSLALIVEGDLTVAKGATLTMQPGTTMKFAGGYDDLFVQGKLLAQGTATKGVAFTSLSDDAHGGDTDGNGVSEGTSSQWGHIDFAAGSTGRFTYAYIGHGGWYYSGNTLVSTTSDAVSFDQSTLASGGGYGLYANGANATITNSTIQNNGSYGLYMDGLSSRSAMVVRDNSFVGNGSYAARIVFRATPTSYTFAGNRGTGNARNGFSTAGTIAGNLRWDNSPTVPFVIEGDVTVAPTATLTLTPGTVVKFAGGYDDLFVQGKLLAQGTATKGVAFTSLSDDAHGGDTDGNGVSEGTSSQWGHIDFAAGSTGQFTYAYIGHGGWYYSGNTLVSSNSSAVTFDRVTLTASGGYGLYAANTNPAVTRSTIQNNGSYGVYYEGLAAGSPLTVTDNLFTGNGGFAGRFVLSEKPSRFVMARNVASGNQGNAFSLAGTLRRSLDWDNTLALTIAGDLTVAPTTTLTLRPGTVVKFASAYDDLVVQGKLLAQGTTTKGIAFTSLNDDTYGGDTNGNGASIGTAGQWGTMSFGEGSVGRFTNTFIGNGGWYYSGNALLTVVKADVSLSRVTLARSDGYSVYTRDALVTIHDSNLTAPGGLWNETPATVIDATNNYWGDVSGPRHPSNRGGAGSTISDGIAYKPWNPAQLLASGGRLQGMQLRTPANLPQIERYSYDAIGRVTSLASTGYSTYTLGYDYDTVDRLVGRRPTEGSGLTNRFTYDAVDQITEVAISNTTSLLVRERYRYDSVGNLVGVTSSRDGVTNYTYDALDRLASVKGPGIDQQYAYDAAGNRTRAGNNTYTYDAGGRVTGSSDGTSFSYDAAGHLIRRTHAGKSTTYTWDGQERLTRIDYPDGKWSGYRYDDWGRRISKRTPDGVTVFYVYAGDRLLQELDTRGRILASYTYDGIDRPISMWRDGRTYFYLLDALGSVIGVANTSGKVVATYRYDPWGNLLASTGAIQNPLRYTAREYDSESGLYFYRARYYDPAVGRFISRDPAGIKAG